MDGDGGDEVDLAVFNPGVDDPAVAAGFHDADDFILLRLGLAQDAILHGAPAALEQDAGEGLHKGGFKVLGGRGRGGGFDGFPGRRGFFFGSVFLLSREGGDGGEGKAGKEEESSSFH